MAPKFARLENPCWRDNAGNQLRRRHVEAQVTRATARIRDADVIPTFLLPFAFCLLPFKNALCAEHLVLVAFLDGNVEAGA